MFALGIYDTINTGHQPYYISIFRTLSIFMHYFNSVCNPFVYAIFNPAFRTAIINALRSIRRGKNYPSARRVCNANTENNLSYDKTKL